MILLTTGRHSRFWRRTRRTAQWLSTVGWMWLCMAATLWAQTPYEEEPEEKTYVPSYMIIIFALAFALMMICRTGKRTTSFRREE